MERTRSKKSRGRSQRRQAQPHFETLEKRELLAADLSALDSGLRASGSSSLFTEIQKQLSGDAVASTPTAGIFGVDAPIIGDQLKQHAAGKIAERIRNVWSTATVSHAFSAATTVEQARAEIAARFKDLGASTTNVIAASSTDGNTVRFTIPLRETLSNQTFNLYIRESPGVDVRLVAPGAGPAVTADLSWSFNLVVGVSNQSFFIDVSASNAIANSKDEIKVDITGTVNPNLRAYGTLGIFGSLYMQDGQQASTFSYQYNVDLKSSDITKNALLDSTTWSTLQFSPRITGNAVLNFDAEFSAVPDFGLDTLKSLNPALDLDFTTDVKINWPLNVTSMQSEIEGELSYTNTQVDLVKLATDFVNPTTGEIKKVLTPFSTVIDALTDPVPGLKQIWQLLNLGPAPSLVDLAKLAAVITGNGNVAKNLERLDAYFLTPIDALLDLPTFEPGNFTQTLGSNPKVPVGFTKTVFTTPAVPDNDRDCRLEVCTNDGKKKKTFRRVNSGWNSKNPVVKRMVDAHRGKTPGVNRKVSKGFTNTVDKNGRQQGFSFPFLDDPGILFEMMTGTSTGLFASFYSSTAGNITIEWKNDISVPGIVGKLLDRVGVIPEFGVAIDFGLAANLGYGYDATGIQLLSNSLDWTDPQRLAVSVTGNYANALQNGHFLDDNNSNRNNDGFGQNGTTAGVIAGDFSSGLVKGSSATDFPELQFSLSAKPFIRVGADFEVLSFSANLTGGLTGNLLFDLNDLPDGTVEYMFNIPDRSVDPPRQPAKPNPSSYTYDGKVRGLELQLIAQNVDNLTLADKIFTGGGFLNAGLSLVFDASASLSANLFGFIDGSWTLPLIKVTIAQGQYPNDDSRLIDRVVASSPVIGQVTGVQTQTVNGATVVTRGGELLLYAGDTGSSRRFTTGSFSEHNEADGLLSEEFIVVSKGATDPMNPALGETFNVTFLGRDAKGDVKATGIQEFKNVTRIVGKGGSGKDIFQIGTTAVEAVLEGGAGDDSITYLGSGIAILKGDEDNDRLIGGSAADDIDGGSGNDTILAGGGNDTMVKGGPGNDTIDGGAGNDTLMGEAGDDTYIWTVSAGVDTITDSLGTDKLVAAGSVDSSGVEQDDEVSITNTTNGKLLVSSMGNGSATATGIESTSFQLGKGHQDGDKVTIDATVNLTSIAVDMIGGQTIFNGTEQNDTITVTGQSRSIKQTESAGEITLKAGSLTTKLFSSEKTKGTLELNTKGGNDTVTIGYESDVQAPSQASAPSDHVTISIKSGDGNDSITVEGGESTIDNGTSTQKDTISVAYGAHLIKSRGPIDLTVQDNGRSTGVADIQVNRNSVNENHGTVIVTQNGITNTIDVQAATETLRIDATKAQSGSRTTLSSTFATTSTSIIGDINGSDTVTITDNSHAISVSTGGGDDTVTIGDGVLGGLNAPLTIDGGDGANDTLMYESSNDTADRPSIIVTSSEVSGLGYRTKPTFSNVENVSLKLGFGQNSVTAATLGNLTVDGGGDLTGKSDTVSVTMVGSSTGSTDTRKLTTRDVDNVNFVLDRPDSSRTNEWLLQGSSATDGLRLSTTTGSATHTVLDVQNATSSSISLRGNTDDQVIVRELLTPTAIDLGGGNDSLQLGVAGATNVDAVAHGLTVQGGAGTDRITLEDSSRSAATTLRISGVDTTSNVGTIKSSASKPVSHKGTEEINLVSSRDANAAYSLNVNDTKLIKTSFDLTGSARDTITATGTNSADIKGGSNDFIVFDHSASSVGVSYDLKDQANRLAYNVADSSSGTTFDGFGAIHIKGSQAGDTFSLNTNNTNTPMFIEGNAGNDVVRVNAIGGKVDVVGGLGENGTPGDDKVQVVMPENLATLDRGLLAKLHADVEQLEFDNTANSTKLTWIAKPDAVRVGNQLVSYATSANEVRVTGGRTSANDNSGNHLIVDATSGGAIRAEIDRDSIFVTGQLRQILEPARHPFGIPTNVSTSFAKLDGNKLYTIDGNGDLVTYNKSLGETARQNGSTLGITSGSVFDFGPEVRGVRRATAATTSDGFVVFDENSAIGTVPFRNVNVVGLAFSGTSGTSLFEDTQSHGFGCARCSGQYQLWVAERRSDGDRLVRYKRFANDSQPLAWAKSKEPEIALTNGHQVKALESQKSPGSDGADQVFVAVGVPGTGNDFLAYRPIDNTPGTTATTLVTIRPREGETSSIGEGATSIAMTQDSLYVTSQSSNRLDMFRRDLSDPLSPGPWTHLRTYRGGVDGNAGLNAPSSVATNGKYVFVASQQNNTIAVFERGTEITVPDPLNPNVKVSTPTLEFRQLIQDSATTRIGAVSGLVADASKLFVGGSDGLDSIPVNSSPPALKRGVGFAGIEGTSTVPGVTLNTGSGADTITMSGFTNRLTVNTGAGNDAVESHMVGFDGGNGHFTINTEDGWDNVVLDLDIANATANVNTGRHPDTFFVAGVKAGSKVDADLGSNYWLWRLGDPRLPGDTATVDMKSVVTSGKEPNVTTTTVVNVEPGAIVDIDATNLFDDSVGSGVQIASCTRQLQETFNDCSDIDRLSLGQTYDSSTNLSLTTDGTQHSINDPAGGPNNQVDSSVGTLIYNGFEQSTISAPKIEISNGRGKPNPVEGETIGLSVVPTKGGRPGAVAPNEADLKWDLDSDGKFDDWTGAPLIPWQNLVNNTADGAVPIIGSGTYTIAAKGSDGKAEGIGYYQLTIDDLPGQAVIYSSSRAGVAWPEFNHSLPAHFYAGIPSQVPISIEDLGTGPITSLTVTWPDGTSETATQPTSTGRRSARGLQPTNFQEFVFTHTFTDVGKGKSFKVDWKDGERSYSTSDFGQDLWRKIDVLPQIPVADQETYVIREGESLTFTPKSIGSDRVLVDFRNSLFGPTVRGFGYEGPVESISRNLFSGFIGQADLTISRNASKPGKPFDPFTVTWDQLNSFGVNDNGEYTFKLYSESDTFPPGATPVVGELAPDSIPTRPGFSTVKLVVQNAAPTGTLTGPSVPIREDQDAVVRFSGVSDSPTDKAGPFVFAIDVGSDGTIDFTESRPTNADFAFTVPASLLRGGSTIPVRGTITDKDGATGTMYTEISVTDVLPTLALSGANSVNEGTPYSVALSASLLDTANGVAQVVVDWGDGTTSTTNVSNGRTTLGPHTYIDNATATITATVIDNDGSYTVQNPESLTISNVVPTLSMTPQSTLTNENTAVKFNLSHADSGNDSLQNWTIQWGDGSPSEIITGDASSVTHLYSVPGTYQVTATATDEDGTHSVPAPSPITVVPSTVAAEAFEGTSTLLTPEVYRQAVLADSPLLYWTFDEPSGNAVDLISGTSDNALAPADGATRIESSLGLGNAAEFSGVGSAASNQARFRSSSLKLAKPSYDHYAIELWTQFDATMNPRYLLEAGSGSVGNSPSLIHGFTNAAAPNGLEFFGPGTRSDGAFPNVPPDNNWHHLVMEVNHPARTHTLYVDGVRAGTMPVNGSSPWQVGFLGVGATFAEGLHGFDGRIDELAIYDLSGILTGQRIANHAAPARRSVSSYSIIGGADASRFHVTNNRLQFVGAPDLEAPTDVHADSVYEVQVQATDGNGGQTTQDFVVTVQNVDPTVPVDSNTAANVIQQDASLGTLVGITASSTDPNGTAVSYSLSDSAGGRFSIDVSTGVVTVANPALVREPGTHTISVLAHDGANGSSTATFEIVIPPPIPAIEKVDIGGPTGQRSMIRDLQVPFNTLVTFASNAFSVTDQSGNPVSIAVTSQEQNGKTTALLTFNGPNLVAGSLPDGNYTLTINKDGVRNRDGSTMSANVTADFYRFFGDFNGDRSVLGTDFRAFVGTYRKSLGDPGYSSHFDVNGDNAVLGTDFRAFVGNYRKSLAAPGTASPAVDPSVETAIESVQVDSGTGQRSMVRSLRLTFNSVITSADDAFVITGSDGSRVAIVATSAEQAGKTVVTLTFNAPGLVAGSLPDGEYELTVDRTKIFRDDFVEMLSDYSFIFHRLFGDHDANRIVDDTDQQFFNIVRELSNDPLEEAPDLFDFDGDDDVDDMDAQFMFAAVGKSLRTPGDTNFDGKVRLDDFMALASNFGAVDAAWSDGDFDGDGDVDFADFLLLSTSFRD